MFYVCAAVEPRALNYCRSVGLTDYKIVTVPEDVPEFERGDTVIVVGQVTPETKKALWDAWRDADGLVKRWVI